MGHPIHGGVAKNKKSVSSFDNVKFTFIPRDFNVAAPDLSARVSFSCDRDFEGLDVIPNWFMGFF